MRLTRWLVFMSMFFAMTALAQPLVGVNTKGMAKNEIESLKQLLNTGQCPCQPQKSLLDCVQANSCPAATELAEFGAGKLREGLGFDQVSEAVVKKYINDHVRYEFDLKDSPRKGAPQPKITIVEFADFECPHCAEMRSILDQVVKKFPNDVALVFKQFPLPHHPFSNGAARAALAAQRQGRFWQMHDVLFMNQGRFNDNKFVELAREIGIDAERFKKDMNDQTLYAMIERDRQEAMKANISGTPAIYIDGRMYMEDKTPDKISAYIQNALKKKK